MRLKILLINTALSPEQMWHLYPLCFLTSLHSFILQIFIEGVFFFPPGTIVGMGFIAMSSTTLTLWNVDTENKPTINAKCKTVVHVLMWNNKAGYSSPSLIQCFTFLDFSYPRQTMVQKYQMENSRSKQFISFKLYTVLSYVTKSHANRLCPTWMWIISLSSVSWPLVT